MIFWLLIVPSESLKLLVGQYFQETKNVKLWGLGLGKGGLAFDLLENCEGVESVLDFLL